MSLDMPAVMVLMGVLAGWLAGYLMERGGFGLRWDVILGLAGSAVGSWLLWVAGAAFAAGLAALAVVAFVAFFGAALAIVAQRRIYPAIS
jgi:uncharacterized membrane protein YeaQ/YmgE (transglycosylase-associated protein family)